jgi:hypothetical protein
MSFDDDLETALNAEPDWTTVDVTLGGKLHTFRFDRMVGTLWAAETDKHPVRPGVLMDMRYGYNLRTLTQVVAPITGRRVERDTLEKLSDEQWAKLFKALPGAHLERIADALFKLNEYLPALEVEAAKKALEAESASNSASPDPSASPTEDSRRPPHRNRHLAGTRVHPTRTSSAACLPRTRGRRRPARATHVRGHRPGRDPHRP